MRTMVWILAMWPVISVMVSLACARALARLDTESVTPPEAFAVVSLARAEAAHVPAA